MAAKRFLALILAGTLVLSSLEVAAADTVSASGSSLSITAASGADGTEEDSTITVYFDNSEQWEDVYVYSTDSSWNVLGAEWPGDAMTDVSGGILDGWCVAEISADTYYVTFESGDGSQTGNIILDGTSDTYWITYNANTVYTTSPVISLGDDGTLETVSWWTTFTDGLSLSVGETITITGITTSHGTITYDDEGNVTENPAWDNAIFAFYSSDDGNIYAANSTEGAKQNYTEYYVGRLDNYGWSTNAEDDVTFTVTLAPDDWVSWFEATQKGAEFTFVATYSTDGKITITSECGDAQYTMAYTTDDIDNVFYIRLTGEKCTLTNLVATYGTAPEAGGVTVHFENTGEWDEVYAFYANANWKGHYTWPGVSISENEDNDGWYDVEVNHDTYYIFFNNGANGEGNRTCWVTLQVGAATEYWVTYEDYLYSLDNPENEIAASTEAPEDWIATGQYTLIYAQTKQDELVDMECDGWWNEFSEALQVEDGQKLVITGETTNLGGNTYDNMVFIFYSGDGGIRTFTYKEYFVGRVDNYGWGTAGYTITSVPSDWDTWYANTQKGAEFTITVTYLEGVITVELECLDAAYVMTYEVSDSSLDYYIALSGEECELTNMSYTYYEAVTALSDFTVELSEDTYIYDGTAKTPEVTVSYEGTNLVRNQDYTLTYSDNVEVGNACVTITAVESSIFTGSVEVHYSIDPIPIGGYQVTLSKSTYTYNGTERKPTVVVTDGSKIVSSSEYTVTYSHNTDAGLAYVEITGKNHYIGTLTATFTIEPKSISKYTATLSKTSYTYNGKAKKPSVTVKSGSSTLSSSNYTVTYSDNKDAGTATVTIMGTGNYTGTITKTFKITKATQKVTAKAKKTVLSVGGTTTISASTTGNGKITYKSSDKSIATVSSSGKIKAKGYGTVKITITAAATSNYKKATKTITIKVRPAATKLSIVSNVSKKSLTIAWKKVSGVTGYQIQYSTSKSFASGKTKSIKVTGASKLSKLVTGLKKGKTYYVRVRTYKKSGGKTYYSTWSAVKSKKISK